MTWIAIAAAMRTSSNEKKSQYSVNSWNKSARRRKVKKKALLKREKTRSWLYKNSLRKQYKSRYRSRLKREIIFRYLSLMLIFPLNREIWQIPGNSGLLYILSITRNNPSSCLLLDLLSSVPSSHPLFSTYRIR